MFAKLASLMFLILLLGSPPLAFSAIVLQYSFDGILGDDVPGGLLDDTGTYTAGIIVGNDASSTIKYALANSICNTSGTSVYFYNENWANDAGDTFVVPNSGGLDFSNFGEFTIEMFVYPDSSGSGQVRRIFSEYVYAYMYITGDDTLHAGRKWGPGDWTQNRTNLTLPDFPLDVWSHVALVWDANASGDRLKLYVDGQLVASDTGTDAATLDSTAGFAIGGYQREVGSRAQFFQGRIDEFRLSDAALEPNEFLDCGNAPDPMVKFASPTSAGYITESPAAIRVLLSGNPTQAVTVDYDVTGGTAVNGIDYVLDAPATLVFDPCQSVQTISIAITGNISQEDKTIELTLSNPVNAQLGFPFQYTYTIKKTLVNSMGMEFTPVPAGTFMMGESVNPIPYSARADITYPTRSELIGKYPYGDPNNFVISEDHTIDGDFDEHPVHEVTISRPFYLATCEVTNAQYKQFDPLHPRDDDSPVTAVSWCDANAFCQWLSEQEGLPYRLPTEAEWEYACRAGTTTLFHTGDSLSGGANAWGLYDMHGGVEEWCYDWYGPYEPNAQIDPVGRIDGDFKVCRGGDNTAHVYFRRSANRLGELQEAKNPLVGFRVVMGEMPRTEPLPGPEPPLNQQNVGQQIRRDVSWGPDSNVPYFEGPREFVKIAPHCYGPVYSHHNHVPGIVECPNGDVLAIWYSCIYENSRELAVAASRLRYGQKEWEPASPFWDTPDRNDHCPCIWFDGVDTLYHFNGLSKGGGYSTNAIIMRTSRDSGANWSKARIIAPEYVRQLPGEPVFRAQDGSIVFGADGSGGTIVFISQDEGLTWHRSSGAAAGIHAAIAQLNDSRLLAFGRGSNIGGKSPKSISYDMGQSWTYSASVFPSISGAQRHVLLRLKEGPLFFASPGPDGIYGALSYDEGETWLVQRLITDVTDSNSDHGINTIDGGRVRMSTDTAEPLGYLSVCQGLDGVIHLISSRLHYSFNLAWLEDAPPVGSSPGQRRLPIKNHLAKIYDANESPVDSNDPWMFIGPGAESDYVSFPRPSKMQISASDWNRPRWSNERINTFIEADLSKGFTVEIATQILSSSSSSAGLEFEVFARCGTLKVHNYSITITPSKIFYRGTEIADGLNNSGCVHLYRMAVREDTTVHIYRDNELLAVKLMDAPGTNWRPSTRGTYIEWGIYAESAEVLLDHIAYDFGGAFEPCILTADLDSDNAVDGRDLGLFAGNWLWASASADNRADIDGDGDVDLIDYAHFALQWLQDCP